MVELIYREETFKIIGAAMEVHKDLGCGFLEAVYQEAMEEELKIQNIPYLREEQLRIYYKGKVLKKYYIADFVCYEKIIVETKALSKITGGDEAQLLNYLKATGYKVGLLINFGSPSLTHKRFVL